MKASHIINRCSIHLLLALLVLTFPSPTLSATVSPTPSPYANYLSALSSVLSPKPPTPRANLDDIFNSPLPSPNATSSSPSSDDRVNAEPCAADSQCKSPRNCIRVTPTAILSCPSDGSVFCFCFPDQLPVCKTNADCDPAEVCARLTDSSHKETFCLSAYVVSLTNDLQSVDTDVDKPTPKSPGGDADTKGSGCVDVDALQGRQLVYPRHRRRTVLCDAALSCATPGHVVVYRAVPMMMKSYCALVSCHTRLIWVNSPKYEKALRLRSRTPALQYTAFAARYGTLAEERALAAAVRVGL